LSNLFKGGFQNLTSSDNAPYIIDMNNREIKETNATKIIRPIEEQILDDLENEDEDNENKLVLQDAMDKAQLLIDEAKQKADKLISEAEIEAGAIKEQARVEGYNLGLAQGKEDSKQEIIDYKVSLEEEKNAFIENTKIENHQELLRAEDQMVDVCCSLIEKLTGILVQTYKPVMLHMINNVMTEAESSTKYIIRVSNDIYPYVADNRDRIVGASNPGISIEVYGDTKLDTDKCMIESDNGIVDLSMDVQVKNLITAIKLLSD